MGEQSAPLQLKVVQGDSPKATSAYMQSTAMSVAKDDGAVQPCYQLSFPALPSSTKPFKELTNEDNIRHDYMQALMYKDNEISRLKKMNEDLSKENEKRAIKLSPGESKLIVNKSIQRVSVEGDEMQEDDREGQLYGSKKRYMKVNFKNSSAQEHIIVRDTSSAKSAQSAEQ